MTYKEFHEWAVRLIADAVIKEGLGGISGALSQILQVSRTYEKEGWKKSK